MATPHDITLKEGEFSKYETVGDGREGPRCLWNYKIKNVTWC